MPVIRDFTLPANLGLLELPEGPNAKLYVAFYSGNDATTKQPWCPDVRAAIPHIDAAFSAQDAPAVAIVSVGEKAEWKDPKNAYRTTWNVQNIPALLRVERVDGKVSQTGKLVEDEITDKAKLAAFLA
ncbi:hypothetical protein N7456_004374 [Penicillium angulare]|uniref:Thioredoxin domain-containing protein n=1 Tax=Penicillium angulare TaxID=116970 RepID=A0A9W9KIB9_9EURO|nr:hypothetical protein N7456_004374 [Penicillium angulare]